MNFNKETRNEISASLGKLYRATREINCIAGNTSLCKDRLPTQMAAVAEELQEVTDAIREDNMGLLVDSVLDSLVTVVECVSIVDGNDSITKSNPVPRLLNQYEVKIDILVDDAITYFDDGNMIDLLGVLEDIAYMLKAPITENVDSLIESLYSKFITVDDLDESEHTEFSLCELIEAEGRYADVYSEINEVNGVDWVVFKSNYDIKNDKAFPKGKFLKSPITFKEPVVTFYE